MVQKRPYLGTELNRSWVRLARVRCVLPPQIRADWLSSDSGPLELHVSTNNDAVIASIIVFDADGGLFGGEVRTLVPLSNWIHPRAQVC